jgi:hypothetical protein
MTAGRTYTSPRVRGEVGAERRVRGVQPEEPSLGTLRAPTSPTFVDEVSLGRLP